jgi:hypothetical protein
LNWVKVIAMDTTCVIVTEPAGGVAVGAGGGTMVADGAGATYGAGDGVGEDEEFVSLERRRRPGE